MKLLLSLTVVIACLVACGPVPPSAALLKSVVPAAASTLVAEAAGLRLTAELDRVAVDPGGEVTVQLSLHNTRPGDVVFEEPCDTQAMVVEVPNPVEPIGREWDGIAGSFKSYALEESQGTPIESSIRTPLRTVAKARPCHAATHGEGVATLGTIPSGDTYETTLTWSADYVRDLPAGPGEVPFSIEVRYDVMEAGNGMFTAETIALDGTITILQGGPAPISAGQAVDAALADEAFAAWLAEQPASSWENANLFLQPGGVKTGPAIPEVPYWDVELYRAPRNWAVVLVDAATGDILKRDFCAEPCNR